MKINPGDKWLQLPDYGQIIGARALRESGGEARWQSLSLVYMDTIRQQEMNNPDHRGTPVFCCVHGAKLFFWPSPSVETEIRIRYYPPEIEA